MESPQPKKKEMTNVMKLPVKQLKKKQSIKTNLKLDLFEKWAMKIFPPLKINFLKLSNYSEDENISNEATYARLIIFLIFITLVLCFITLGQLIWISFLSRDLIVVQPFIPKISNPFCK